MSTGVGDEDGALCTRASSLVEAHSIAPPCGKITWAVYPV